MKKNLTFYSIISILLLMSVLFICCKTKDEGKAKEQSPEAELKVAAADGFVNTYVFPNNTFKPSKEILPNDDILLHPEVWLKGQIPDAEATYNITLLTDYYDDVDVADCLFVVTAISPDSASRRTQQYKLIFNDTLQTKEIGKEDGRILKRNTRCVFPGMKFSSTGEARFKVEMAPGHGRFSFRGIKSLSVKAEKVKEE